jgi:hypothetical protein
VSPGDGRRPAQTRKLYTDDEQSLIDACRPLAFNGILDVASRGDLADRSIALAAPEISDERRREEEDLDQEFTAAAPAILGGLLDGVATALAKRRSVAATIKQKLRMADFAVFAAAAAPAFGWTKTTSSKLIGKIAGFASNGSSRPTPSLQPCSGW